MIFLTFNDPPGGIFSSQVIEVCRFLEEKAGERVTLVSFFPLRNYFDARSKVKAYGLKSFCFPMLPGWKFWKLHSVWLFLVCLISGEKKILCRGAFATVLAQMVKKAGLIRRVVYDCRGALAAEAREFNFFSGSISEQDVATIEKQALQESDAVLLVSEALRKFLSSQYGILPDNRAVIPCTVSDQVLEQKDTSRNLIRERLKIPGDALVGVFSGSVSPWQTGQSLRRGIQFFLSKFPRSYFIFISPGKFPFDDLISDFPGRILSLSLLPGEVHAHLQASDIAFLLRDHSITNSVASPVKFAEYLAAGNCVYISEHIGDFSEMVRELELGWVDGVNHHDMKEPDAFQKSKCPEMARRHFSKMAYLDSYKKLLAL